MKSDVKILGEPYDSHLRSIKGNISAIADHLASIRSFEGLLVPSRKEVIQRIRNRVQNRLGSQFVYNHKYCYIGEGSLWEYFVKTSLSQSDNGDYFTGKEVWDYIGNNDAKAYTFFSQYSSVFLYPFMGDAEFAKIARWATNSSAVFGINWDDRLYFGINSWWKKSWPFLDATLSQRSLSKSKYSGMGLNWLFFPEGGHLYPISHKAPLIKGLVYIGSMLGNKGNLATQISLNLKSEMVLFGPGTQNGEILPSELSCLYQSYTAGLALSAAGWGFNATHLKCRHFEIPCSGGLMLAEYTKDLEKVFEIDKEILTFNSISEAVSKYKWILAHPEQSEAIRKRGHLKAQTHTWNYRFSTLLSELDQKTTQYEI